MTTTVKLSELQPGHKYPGASVNARSTARDEGLDMLVASIRAEGLLQSLLVCPAEPGRGHHGYYVIAGNRRLAALQKIGGDPDVPVIVREDVTPGSALALSLTENITQVPLHPVDRYETFARLHDGGKAKSAADIAATYAVTEIMVKRSLALGQLSAKIREAWRAGKIDAGAAQAFTIAKDLKHQDDVLARLTKAGHLHAWNVRRELGGDQHDSNRFLKFVGKKDYEAAGGRFQEDLFSGARGEDDDEDAGDVIVSDFPLLVRLAGEKIKAKCDELVKAGWAWAEDEYDLPSGATWNWRKIAIAAANAPKEQKAKAGCAVSVNRAGKFQIKYGLLKPGAKEDKPAKAKGEKAKPSTALSNSLKQRLESQFARAIKDALVDDEHETELSGILAKLVASQITPERFGYMPSQVRDAMRALRDAITPSVLDAALRKRFDAKDYFSSAPKPVVLKAITETGFADDAKKLSGKTKAETWKFAVAHIKPDTGWLPPELRSSHYAGPGAKEAKPAEPTARKKAA